MRIKLFTFLLLFTTSFSLQAQTWTIKQQGLTNTFIQRMWFTSATTGYATLGDNTGGINNILKTTNGGNNWTFYNSANSNAGYDVNFINANTGFTCSFNGEISRTTNAGVNWTRVYTNGSSNYLYTMGFFDATTGFSGGFAYVVRTTNGGLNWAETGLTGFQYSNSVLSSTKAMMCGSSTGSDGGVWTSVNSGGSWVYSQITTANILYDIYFTDANTGYVGGGGGLLYKTTNGGTNWNALTTGTTNSIQCVYFQNANTGFIAGSGGFVMKTTNGGTNWITCTTYPTVNTTYADMYFFDANNGIMTSTGGSVLKTSDGGSTWVSVGNNQQLNAISFPDANTGYAAGVSAVVQKSTDGGNNWSILTGIPTTANLLCSDFVNSTTGYIGGNTGNMLKTTNGGTNFTAVATGTATNVLCIDFIDENTGYFGTTLGVVRATTNGGTNWTAYTSGTTTNITGMSFIDANTGFVTSTAGSVRKTTNAGVNWTTVATGSTQQMNSASFLDANTGYVCGNSGTIYKTTNGGTNWTQQGSGVTTNALIFIKFGSTNAGIAVGNAGTILVTNNGGTNWTTQTSNTTQNLRCVNMQASNNIFACGGLGTIINSNDQVLPVELASFTSNVNGTNVMLNWKTSSEQNNAGFEIERSFRNDNLWIKAGYVTGNGTTTGERSYAFEDKNLASGTYQYRLKQIDFNGNYSYKNLSNEVIIGKPVSFELSQNYPNPFNPATKINFQLPFDGNVSLKIFDISGKEVMTLIDGFKSADYYTVNFDAKSLSSGIYFAKLTSVSEGRDFAKTIKMILSK